MADKVSSTPNLILVLAVFTGSVSMLMFGMFLFNGSPDIVQMGLSESGVLAWDGLLSSVFFVQHSVMLRRRFRFHLSNIIPPPYHGALFAIVSGMILIFLVVFWQPSTVSLLELRGLPRRLARGAFFLGMAGFAWGAFALRSFDPFGTTPIRAHLRGERLRPLPLVVRGPYAWVRHPLYLFTLLLMWSCPEVTADRLLFNILCTVWIYASTFLEEADLLFDLGDAYRDYQRKVPRLIPWRRH